MPATSELAAAVPEEGSIGGGSRALHRGEMGLATFLLGAMALLPLGNAVVRLFSSSGVPKAILYAQNLTLVVTFLGAALAARRGEHLSLSAAAERLPRRLATAARVGANAVAMVVTGLLAYAGVMFVRAEAQSPATLGFGIPVWLVEVVIPVGFAAVALRLWWREPLRRVALALALALGGIIAAVGIWEVELPGFFWLCAVALAMAVAFGAPIFAGIGGLAMLMFWEQWTPIPSVVVEMYRLVASPTLPAIPLFTLAGFLLAGAGASRRLVEVFQALFGWIPGGTAVAAALVCAFFTTFTGASGVTILALGALLLPALRSAGNEEQFSLGLITASGSLGLLFFPSLPVILYAVVAEVDVLQMFVGAMVPGILVVGSVAVLGVQHGLKHRAATTVPFSWPRARAALWAAKWELLLPLVVLLGFLSGLLTFVESAALGAAYTFVIETLVHKELDWKDKLPRQATACVSLVGAVLIILGVALGLTSYLIDAQIPAAVIDWAQKTLESKLMFLLLFNVVLLAVGCVMDIFSAIVVVAPLAAPVGVAFGVDPVHLGVIFLANLELGYITPPVGMNLFISSMRFGKPLGAIYRSTVPFFLLRLAVVLLITYVPVFSTWLR